MNTLTLGIRNAFRNTVRTTSIIVILGLSIGLCLVMLVAHQAVGQKISEVKATVGTTITISPAGFSDFSQANNALTTDQLRPVAALAHIVSLAETLTDRVTTAGTDQESFLQGKGGGSGSTTSLASPVTLNSTGGGGKGFRVFINGGGSLPADFSPPISVVGTTDPEQLGGTDAKITSGTMLDGTKDSNNAMISTDMATKNGLHIGSTFTAYNATLTVSGIFDTGTQGGNNTIVVSLAALERLTGQSGDVTSAVATVDSLDNLSDATTAVKHALGSSADVQSSQDEADSAVTPLQNVASISFISLIGAVIAGSIIVLLTMVMVVRERRREIGILKAIGAGNARIILQFMCEAVTLTLAGAVIGVFIGVVGGNPVTNMLVSSSATATSDSSTAAGFSTGGPGNGTARFARNSFGARPLTGNVLRRSGTSLSNSFRNITTNVGWNVLLYGLAAALLIAILGSALAGWMIARVKPYEVMRAE